MNPAEEHNEPASFYFNGRKLPKWSSQWHLCGLNELLNGFEDDWDEFIGYKHIWHLQCRLDHQGVIESEDPAILRVCAQEVLIKLISQFDWVTQEVSNKLDLCAPASEIVEGVISGISRMITLSANYNLSLWTNGSEIELNSLREYMSCYQASIKDCDQVDLPHITERRSEIARRAHFQLKELRTLAQTQQTGKEFRRMIYGLPAC